MSRHSRALIVGLGADTLPILNTVYDCFDEQGKASYMKAVCYTHSSTGEQVSDTIEIKSLSINGEILNDIFFDEQTRKWSGPNWQSWGQNLASNRTFGKLAIHHHLRQLHDELLTKINELSASGTSRIKLYLIAHAHDPFASGMVMDVAYLLHKLALTRGGSVNGMILLPGIQGDPLVENLDDEEMRLASATAYALLREIYQVGMSRSFYRNHHIDIDLTAKNMSPFQTGDCYLIGGEQKEPYSPLIYDVMCHEIGLMIYLQSMTALVDKIGVSNNNSGFVSSFGVQTSSLQREQENNTNQDAVTIQLANRLLSKESSVDAFETTVQRWLALRQSESSSVALPIQTQDTGVGESKELLAEQDAKHLASVTALRTREMKQATDSKQATDQLEGMIDEELTKIRHHDGMTLTRYQQIVNHWQTSVETAFQEGERQLQELSKRADVILMDIKEARSNYGYVTVMSIRTELLTFIMSIVALIVGITLFFLGFIIQTVMWFIVTVICIYIVPRNLQNRRKSDRYSRYVQLQQDLLFIQTRIMEQQITNAYNDSLKNILNQQVIMADGQNRIAYITAKLKKFVDEVNLNVTDISTPEMASELQFTSRLLDKLWDMTHAEDSEISSGDIRQKASELLAESIVSQNEKTYVNTFIETVEDIKSHSFSNLSVNVNLIPQQYQQDVEYIAGTQNWRNIDINDDIQDYLRSLRIQAVDITDKVSKEQKIFLLRIRRNIPLHTLLTLERWQLNYKRLCEVDLPERKLRFASLFHPTRAAVAGIDITNRQLPYAKDYPSFVQILVTIIHHNHVIPEPYKIATNTINDLANTLNIAIDAGINYDELSGALNSRLELLEQMLQQATSMGYESPEMASDATRTWHGWLNYITQDMNPRLSEDFADWEIWALQELKFILQSDRTKALTQDLSVLLYHLMQVSK